jgi:hypothetical protein
MHASEQEFRCRLRGITSQPPAISIDDGSWYTSASRAVSQETQD